MKILCNIVAFWHVFPCDLMRLAEIGLLWACRMTQDGQASHFHTNEFSSSSAPYNG